MNAEQREYELRALLAEQRDLRTRFQELETRVERFERDAEEERKQAVMAAMRVSATTPPVKVQPAPEPSPTAPPPLPPADTSQPPPLPPVLPSEAVQAAAPLPAQASPFIKSAPVAPTRKGAGESLEMQIGTTWLVRVGVVILLTSLACFGTFLYHHVVPRLGPAAKIALMYLGAGALTGAGAWLERSKLADKTEALRNYAGVVLAGGLAAVYYVTYSAHWNPHLRVVSNPLVAGALLLGWASFMVWLANRRGSELLATFAILLAFYTSAVNEISSFTLVANLFLTGGAVYLLRRQLWQIFPFVSLLATFGSYGFWRFSHAYIEGAAALSDAAPQVAITSSGFWIESGFLLMYWLLFTWAVFTTNERVLPSWRRAGFVTVNNTAFFLLTTWLLLAAYPGTFWKLSLGFGVVLLALAETIRRWPRVPDADTENAYLLQGVLLVTLGFIGYFSGWQLGLALAVQSAVLLWRAGLRWSRLLLGLSCAVAGVSTVYALRHLHGLDVAKVWAVGLAEGALLIGNAWWSQRLLDKTPLQNPAPDGKPTVFQEALTQVPTWFAFLGSAAWFWMLERPVTAEAGHAPLLAVAAVLLTASVYVLRVRTLPLFAQVYLTAAHFHWLIAFGWWDWDRWHAWPPVWSPLALLVSTLALGHWWQWRRTAEGALRRAKADVAFLDAALAVSLLYYWLRPHLPGPDARWMAGSALLSLVVLGYGLSTRYRALAAAGQGLLAVGIVHFFNQWDHSWSGMDAERWLALSPLLVILVSIGIGRRFVPPRAFDQNKVGLVTTLYEVLALALFLFWVERYVPRSVQYALLGTGGLLVFALGCVYREKRWLFLSAVPTVAGLLIFFLLEDTWQHRHWLGLVGVAVLAGQQQFGKRWLKGETAIWFPAPAQAALMIAATLCAWVILTAHMERLQGSAFTLAASWSLFAPLVFAAGLFLHERVYRWLGLLILAATLGHIVLFDISQLDALGKAISFLALGLVVLGVGFFYVRFQSKFRDLL